MRLFRPFSLLLAAVLTAGSATGAIKRGFFDHALCCGPQPLVNAEALPAAGKFAPATFALATATTATTTPVSATAAPGLAPTATSTPTGGAASQPSSSPEEVDGYLKLGFDRLASFTFNPAPYDPTKPNEPPPSSADQIPDSIKAFTGKKAVVSGFMLPVKTEKGLVTEFLLMRDAMMCCYGVIPNINEWIIVKMTNGGVQSIQDVPLSVFGKLQVEEVFESGYLSGIYLLEGEKMVTSKP